MSKDQNDHRIVESSGDVFKDIGVEPRVRDNLKIELALAICSLMERRNLTQKQAAAILGTDQAKVSSIVRSRPSGFSVERLFRFVTALGYDINIRMEPTRKGNGVGEIKMIATA